MPRYAQLVMGPAGSGKVCCLKNAMGWSKALWSVVKLAGHEVASLQRVLLSFIVLLLIEYYYYFRVRTAPPWPSMQRLWTAQSRWWTWIQQQNTLITLLWQVSMILVNMFTFTYWMSCLFQTWTKDWCFRGNPTHIYDSKQQDFLSAVDKILVKDLISHVVQHVFSF